MSHIKLVGITKCFKIAQRPRGLLGALRGAFVREYQEIKALDCISFEISAGELVGYIGPNGAGKSTTVKVMSGILVPDQGHCLIDGRTPWLDRVQHVSNIGVVFGQRSQLWWDVPVIDSFELLRDIYNVETRVYRKRLKDLADLLNISALLDTPVRQLSLGQRMRCELAAALLHDPKLLFLDEPTIGLDAVSKLALRSFLKERNQKSGVTMILTTHDMADIETLCQRVMVIGRGKLLFDGSLQHLRKKYAPMRRIKARLSGPCQLSELKGAEKVEISAQEVTVWFRPDQAQAHELIALLAAACPLKDLVVEEPNIDEMIAHMYQELKI